MNGYSTTQILPSGLSKRLQSTSWPRVFVDGGDNRIARELLLSARKDERILDDADSAVGFIEAHASYGLCEA